jgi:GntR family transcriptional regulator
MNTGIPKQRHTKPLYQVVEDYLREQIDTGQLVPGDLIPSEPQLAKRLGVSQGTAKKAIDNLVWERRLFRHQGKGTYVSKIDFNNSLFRFTTYGGADGRPARIHKKTTARRIEEGSEPICRRLAVRTGTPLLYMERVGYVDERPVMVEYSHWRADVVPGLEREEVHIPDLLYALIVEKYEVPVVRAEETLTAGAADEKTAHILEIEPGTPVLVLNRTTYTKENSIIEARTSKGRADKFSYRTEIR